MLRKILRFVIFARIVILVEKNIEGAIFIYKNVALITPNPINKFHFFQFSGE